MNQIDKEFKNSTKIKGGNEAKMNLYNSLSTPEWWLKVLIVDQLLLCFYTGFASLLQTCNNFN